MPEGAEKFNFASPNSLSVEMLAPSQRFGLRYDNNGFMLDLEWMAIAEPHDCTAMEELATGTTGQRLHIEQCDRVRGTIRHHGEEHRVECYSIRDTSFGVRKFTTVAKGSYFWGIVIESDRFTHDEVCEQIKRRLAKGPGTAFDTLRERYTHPSI